MPWDRGDIIQPIISYFKYDVSIKRNKDVSYDPLDTYNDYMYMLKVWAYIDKMRISSVI